MLNSKSFFIFYEQKLLLSSQRSELFEMLVGSGVRLSAEICVGILRC